MQTTKKIKINNAEVPVIIGNRALIEYKRETGRTTIDDVEDALRLTWHGLKAGAKQSGLRFEMSFEEWIDYTDAHPELVNDAQPDEQEAAADKKKATT
jgi:hypothetical protein